MTPPPLAELMTRYLAAPAGPAETGSDVVPHEVLTAFRIDARTAWAEAKEAIGLFGETTDLPAPPEWSTVVTWAEAVAVPLAIGHYPQLARDVGRLVKFDPTPTAPVTEADFPTLRRWAVKQAKGNTPANRLTAAAMLRLIGRLDDADSALHEAKSLCTGIWAAVHANESATLRFARGEFAAAADAWAAMPDTPAVAFNRGLARLALCNREKARADFRTAVAGLKPELSWSDLARLYLAVAEMPQK